MDQYQSDLKEMQSNFAIAFENLGNRIFEEKATKLTAENTTALGQLLDPLRHQIGEFRDRVDRIYTADSSDRAALKVEVQSLAVLNQQITRDAQNLTNALKGQAKAQGSWGEMILESILEKSGLIRDSDYRIQQTLVTEQGKRLRPDVIVYLPDAKHIVIDAKVSLTAYERYCSGDDAGQRDSALLEHISSVRGHIKELGAKQYSELYQITSPDFVLLFVPIEGAWSLAIQNDSKLFWDAFESNIVLVTSSTLMTTLRIIASIWKKERQTKNALEIARQSGALYDQFVRFYDDLDSLGTLLRKAEEAYISARDRLKTGRGNLVKKAEDIRKLGANASKTLPSAVIEEAVEEIGKDDAQTNEEELGRPAEEPG
jgi:DNA recombination protein RmuC